MMRATNVSGKAMTQIVNRPYRSAAAAVPLRNAMTEATATGCPFSTAVTKPRTGAA